MFLSVSVCGMGRSRAGVIYFEELCRLWLQLYILFVCLICVLFITVMASAVGLLIKLCMSPQNLKIQMKDFEATAEPLQEWLTTTERMVQGTSSRLHDLPSKRREQQNLQVISHKPF